MKTKMRTRIAWVVAALVSVLTLVSIRLIEIQVGRHEKYLQLAAINHTFKTELKARRGDIVDCQGNLLASSVPCKTVMADLFQLRQILAERRKMVAKGKKTKPELTPADVAKVLAPTLGMSAQVITAKLEEKRDLIVLAKKIPDASWATLEALRLPGIKATDEFVRYYPDGRNASQVIGFVDSSQTGRSGIEASMDQYLQGIDGWFVSERDARRNEIRAYRSQDKPVSNGYTVVLTLDQTLQQIVEEEMDRAMVKFQPAAAYCIVMRPKTGEILALANRPTTSFEQKGEIDWSAMRNRCITDTFEPGSTFKIVTIAAALDQNLITLNTPINCENGSWEFGGKTLHDTGSYGVLTAEQTLQKSSNIGTVKTALLLGSETLYRYIRAFGFGESTLDSFLPGEVTGSVRPPSKWSPISISRVPIGYEVSATPVQMAAAMSVIANGGAWVKPLLVSEIRDETGKAVARYNTRSVRQVIRHETAAKVARALRSAVEGDGTAQMAQVPGFIVAGKTGTVRKWDAGLKDYSKTRYLASFIGFLPSRDPEITVLVMIDEPMGKEYYGGHVAAPVFSVMASRIARHLDLVPEVPLTTMEVAHK